MTQKQFFKAKLNESFLRNQRDDFIDTVLKKCKENDGRITNVEELQTVLSKYDNESLKKYLRQEIQYQKTVHNKDSHNCPELYEVNNPSLEQMTENLILML